MRFKNYKRSPKVLVYMQLASERVMAIYLKLMGVGGDGDKWVSKLDVGGVLAPLCSPLSRQ